MKIETYQKAQDLQMRIAVNKVQAENLQEEFEALQDEEAAEASKSIAAEPAITNNVAGSIATGPATENVVQA